MNDTRLTRALRAAAAAGTTQACPDAPQLLAFGEGRLQDAARDEMAAHVAQCAWCADALQLVAPAGEWAGAVAQSTAAVSVAVDASSVVVAMRRAPRPPLARWIPAALAAGLVVALGFWWAPGVREDGNGVLRGSDSVATEPRAGAVLPAAPERLAWPCEIAPQAHEVELLDATATSRWHGEPAGCVVALPSELRAALQPGDYLWRLRRADGSVVAGPYSFRIEP